MNEPRSTDDSNASKGPGDAIDLGKLARDAFEEALRERGHVNILIAGRTGVGKSTLINSVFQGDFATTGQGRPVTKNTREITKPGIPLSILDTRGLELADFSSTIRAIHDTVAERRKDSDPRKHVHVAWVCIAEDLRRVEDAEINLAKSLSDEVPVLAVITKARSDGGFRQEVQSLLPEVKNVLRVRAIAERLDDGHNLPPAGLEELVKLTMDLVPEGQQRAFVAAQKVSLQLKRTASHGIVAAAAATAAAAGAAPIPFSDAAVIVPVQIGMLAGISATYGLRFGDGFLSTLVASVLGTVAATVSGQAMVGALLKLIPGVGSAAGGAISAATAALITTTLGELYIATLELLFEQAGGESPPADKVADAFRTRVRETLGK